MFDKFKGIAALGQLAARMPEIEKAGREIREDLKSLRVAAEAGGGAVRVWVTGDLCVDQVEFAADFCISSDQKALAESLIVEATNLAIENAKRTAASCAQEKLSRLNLPIDPGMLLGNLGLGSGNSK